MAKEKRFPIFTLWRLLETAAVHFMSSLYFLDSWMKTNGLGLKLVLFSFWAVHYTVFWFWQSSSSVWNCPQNKNKTCCYIWVLSQRIFTKILDFYLLEFVKTRTVLLWSLGCYAFLNIYWKPFVNFSFTYR